MLKKSWGREPQMNKSSTNNLAVVLRTRSVPANKPWPRHKMAEPHFAQRTCRVRRCYQNFSDKTSQRNELTQSTFWRNLRDGKSTYLPTKKLFWQVNTHPRLSGDPTLSRFAAGWKGFAVEAQRDSSPRIPVDTHSHRDSPPSWARTFGGLSCTFQS